MNMIDMLKETQQLQVASAHSWYTRLVHESPRSDRTIDSDVELTMRNPAVYLDRILSGFVDVSVVRKNEWNRLAREARGIADAHYAVTGTTNVWADGRNPLMELQNHAYCDRLTAAVSGALALHLVRSSEEFALSLEESYGDRGLLSYFYGNAQATKSHVQN